MTKFSRSDGLHTARVDAPLFSLAHASASSLDIYTRTQIRVGSVLGTSVVRQSHVLSKEQKQETRIYRVTLAVRKLY